MNENSIYETIRKRKLDNLEDYDICLDGKKIGELQLTIHPDYVFIRQISIDDTYKRCGHATNIIDRIRNFYDKPIRLCISTHSKSAVLFWRSYFEKHNAEHIRGDLYSLIA